MRVFETKTFARFRRRAGLSEAQLLEAVARIERGHIDADLGGGVIKQRVARPGAGRSGGYRTILLFRRGERAIFAFGFAKNRMGNIQAADLMDLRRQADLLLNCPDSTLERLVEGDGWQELTIHGRKAN